MDNDWGNTKATYRFLVNDRVSEADVPAEHFGAARACFAASEGPILVLHDTTELSYKRKDIEAVGVTRNGVAGASLRCVSSAVVALVSVLNLTGCQLSPVVAHSSGPEAATAADDKSSNDWRLSVDDNGVTGRTVKAHTEIYVPGQRAVMEIDLLCVPPDGQTLITVDSFATTDEEGTMAAVPVLMNTDGKRWLPVGDIKWSGGKSERIEDYFVVGDYSNEIESTSESISTRLPVALEMKTEHGVARFQIPAENESVQKVLSECRNLREHRFKQRQADDEKLQVASETQPLSAAQLIDRSTEIANIDAELSESLRSYAQRSREKRIYSRTQEYKYASYMHDWIAKIELFGTLNFPAEARRQHLSGSLLLDVALNADGSVNSIAVLRPSGFRILDDAALRIVHLAAPYAPFPDNIRRETDVLHIIRTWQFLSNERSSPK